MPVLPTLASTALASTALADPVTAAGFVRAQTALRPVPMVPEIRLHLAADAFELWERTETQAGRREQPPPFWAFAWPGGLALARYLLDHPAEVAGRSVLDLGAGSGLAAIAAALAGAGPVLASEVDPLAHAAIGLNGAANGVEVAVRGDVLGGTGEDADVVLAGDIWYERELASRTAGLLTRAAGRGARVIAADIGRAFLPRGLFRELASYQVPVIADLEDADVKLVRVLTLV
ncbi:MAG TPA: 50S ribosomal protein L11 methyltransferase [Streptosporangiaceae bacterium]